MCDAEEVGLGLANIRQQVHCSPKSYAEYVSAYISLAPPFLVPDNEKRTHCAVLPRLSSR